MRVVIRAIAYLLADETDLVNKSMPLLLALGLAILVSVVTYLMTSSWQSAKPVGAEETALIDQQAELNTQLMQETLSEQIATQAQAEAQQRLESTLGQTLFSVCYEWTEFYDNHPNDNSLARRDEACKSYRDYVDSGVVPE